MRAQAKGPPWLVARAERALAQCSAGAEAGRNWTAALAGHALTPDGYEQARAQLAHGEQLRRTRRRTEARTALRAALTTFEYLQATPWADPSRDRARRDWRAGAPAGPAASGLTPQ